MVRIHVWAIVFFMSGCTALANSPMVINQLKVRSAGFTGCAVDANVITNVIGNMYSTRALCWRHQTVVRIHGV